MDLRNTFEKNMAYYEPNKHYTIWPKNYCVVDGETCDDVIKLLYNCLITKKIEKFALSFISAGAKGSQKVIALAVSCLEQNYLIDLRTASEIAFKILKAFLLDKTKIKIMFDSFISGGLFKKQHKFDMRNCFDIYAICLDFECKLGNLFDKKPTISYLCYLLRVFESVGLSSSPFNLDLYDDAETILKDSFENTALCEKLIFWNRCLLPLHDRILKSLFSKTSFKTSAAHRVISLAEDPYTLIGNNDMEFFSNIPLDSKKVDEKNNNEQFSKKENKIQQSSKLKKSDKGNSGNQRMPKVSQELITDENEKIQEIESPIDVQKEKVPNTNQDEKTKSGMNKKTKETTLHKVKKTTKDIEKGEEHKSLDNKQNDEEIERYEQKQPTKKKSSSINIKSESSKKMQKALSSDEDGQGERNFETLKKKKKRSRDANTKLEKPKETKDDRSVDKEDRNHSTKKSAKLKDDVGEKEKSTKVRDNHDKMLKSHEAMKKSKRSIDASTGQERSIEVKDDLSNSDYNGNDIKKVTKLKDGESQKEKSRDTTKSTKSGDDDVELEEIGEKLKKPKKSRNNIRFVKVTEVQDDLSTDDNNEKDRRRDTKKSKKIEDDGVKREISCDMKKYKKVRDDNEMEKNRKTIKKNKKAIDSNTKSEKSRKIRDALSSDEHNDGDRNRDDKKIMKFVADVERESSRKATKSTSGRDNSGEVGKIRETKKIMKLRDSNLERKRNSETNINKGLDYINSKSKTKREILESGSKDEDILKQRSNNSKIRRSSDTESESETTGESLESELEDEDTQKVRSSKVMKNKKSIDTCIKSERAREKRKVKLTEGNVQRHKKSEAKKSGSHDVHDNSNRDSEVLRSNDKLIEKEGRKEIHDDNIKCTKNERRERKNPNQSNSVSNKNLPKAKKETIDNHPNKHVTTSECSSSDEEFITKVPFYDTPLIPFSSAKPNMQDINFSTIFPLQPNKLINSGTVRKSSSEEEADDTDREPEEFVEEEGEEEETSMIGTQVKAMSDLCTARKDVKDHPSLRNMKIKPAI